MAAMEELESCFVTRTAQAEAGFPWEEVRILRREKMRDFEAAVASMFRELCDENVKDKRLSLNSPMVIIPCMKTPATTKKFRSRVVKQCWKEAASPQLLQATVTAVPVPDEPLSPPMTLSPRNIPPLAPNTPLQPKEKVCSMEPLASKPDTLPIPKPKALLRPRKQRKQGLVTFPTTVTPLAVEVVMAPLRPPMVSDNHQQVLLQEEQMETSPPLSLQPIKAEMALPEEPPLTKAQTKTMRSRKQEKERPVTLMAVEVVRTQPLMMPDNEQQVLLQEEPMKIGETSPPLLSTTALPEAKAGKTTRSRKQGKQRQVAVEVVTSPPLLSATALPEAKTTRSRKQGKQRQVTPMAVEVVRTLLQPLTMPNNVQQVLLQEEQVKRPKDLPQPLGAATPLLVQTKAQTKTTRSRKQGRERQVTPMAVEAARTPLQSRPLQSLMMFGHQQQLLLQEEHMKRTGSERVLTLQELTAASPCAPGRMATPSSLAKSKRLSPKPLDAPSSLAGTKRLRSVSLVRVLPEAKRQSLAKQESLASGSDRDSVEGKGLYFDTPEVAKATPSFHLGMELDDTDWSDPAGKLRPRKDAFYGGKLASSNKMAGSEVKSFIPVKAKKPAMDKEAQTAMLQEKVLKKQEEESRRKEELERKKQQEIQLKKRRREERAHKVAEKQAAMKMENEIKKKTAVGNTNVRAEQIKMKKAKEIEEKNRKLKDRQAAAEARRKQDEETQKLRLQQMEEEKKMAADLAVKRREADEEGKRLRRLEKQRQDKERQLQHEAELRAKEQELKRKLGEEEIAAKRVGKGHVAQQQQHSSDDDDIQQHLTRLLAGTTKVNLHLRGSEEEKSDSPEPLERPKSMNEFLQGFYSALKGEKPAVMKPSNNAAPPPSVAVVNSSSRVVPPSDVQVSSSSKPAPPSSSVPVAESSSPATPCLNTTFVKEKGASYAMTPMDPLVEADNYCIHDLGSDDSTDEEDCPKKEIPLWAMPDQLEKTIQNQLEAIRNKQLRIQDIFPPEELLQTCKLGKIFKAKKRRFIERTSSACWSPMPSNH